MLVIYSAHIIIQKKKKTTLLVKFYQKNDDRWDVFKKSRQKCATE